MSIFCQKRLEYDTVMIMLKKELLLNLHDAIAKIDTTECYSQTLITVYKNEIQKMPRECFCNSQ